MLSEVQGFMNDYICSLKAALSSMDRQIREAFAGLIVLFEERERLSVLIEQSEMNETTCEVEIPAQKDREKQRDERDSMQFERLKWHRSFFDNPLEFEEAVFVDMDIDVDEVNMSNVTVQTQDPEPDYDEEEEYSVMFSDPIYEDFNFDDDPDADADYALEEELCSMML